jgi:hypothetical protein
MGKNGASRNYTNRTYAITNSRTRTYQEDRYGKSNVGQKKESTRTTKSSKLLRSIK